MTSGAAPIAQVRPSSRWMPILKIMVPLRAGSPFQEIPNHCPRRVTYRTVTLTGRPRILPEHAARNPRALALGDFATEVMDLLSANPTPHEILVKGVLMHRWAERDGTWPRGEPRPRGRSGSGDRGQRAAGGGIPHVGRDRQPATRHGGLDQLKHFLAHQLELVGGETLVQVPGRDGPAPAPPRVSVAEVKRAGLI